MTVSIARRQRGVALLAMLALIMLAATWLLVSQLNAESGGRSAINRNHNADVLNRAKLALIGYVAMKAAESGERNPGRLPCPEGAAYVGDPTNEGVAWSGFGTDCTSVGRLPWRTLSLEKLLDTASEPLWYVVGPTWRLSSSTSTLTINSNTVGDISVDGQNVVALIIAPGPAMNAQSATGCTAKSQVRNIPSSTIDSTNFLECFNAGTLSFTTTASSDSYNDQVVRITVADVMPAIEAGIASRIEREIAPLLSAVYSADASWGNLTTLLPMANAFSVASSNVNAYAGTPAMQGLLPLSHAETGPGSGAACTPNGTAPNYCEPNFVQWSGTPTVTISSGVTQYPAGATSCTISTSTTTTVNCTVYGWASAFAAAPSVDLRIDATASNAGAALRTFNTAVALGGINAGYTATATLDSSGAALVKVTGTSPSANATTVSDATCGLSGFFNQFLYDCFKYTLSVPIFLLADHANIHTLLSTTNGTTGWFVRNKWHELAYYAVASAVGPGGTGSCVESSTCLRVTYHPSDGKQRAVLLLAGSALTGQNRTSSTLSNWFEGANAVGVSPFEMHSATLSTNRTFNDRVAVISANN